MQRHAPPKYTALNYTKETAMFRRREDGSDDMMNDSEQTTSTTAPSSPSIATPSTPSVPTQPTAAMPSAAPAAQAFRPAPPQAAMAAANRTPAQPATPAAPAMAEPARTPSAPMAPAPRANNKRVLTVGPDIQMKGEITSCDRVVIEGMVDATMRDVHTVELAETGSLKGTAEVEDAEISGSFEGDLVVRGKLTIHSSGRVRGNVTYGEIEIQRGGQISGNIRNAADAKAAPHSKPKAA